MFLISTEIHSCPLTVYDRPRRRQWCLNLRCTRPVCRSHSTRSQSVSHRITQWTQKWQNRRPIRRQSVDSRRPNGRFPQIRALVASAQWTMVHREHHHNEFVHGHGIWKWLWADGISSRSEIETWTIHCRMTVWCHWHYLSYPARSIRSIHRISRSILRMFWIYIYSNCSFFFIQRFIIIIFLLLFLDLKCVFRFGRWLSLLR